MTRLVETGFVGGVEVEFAAPSWYTHGGKPGAPYTMRVPAGRAVIPIHQVAL